MRLGAQRGSALFEGALWLATLLPLCLGCLTLAAVMHDQGVLQVTPEAALREVPGGTLRWVPDGHGGRYEADLAELRLVVTRLSQQALLEAQREVFKARNVSTQACFWIFSVNPSTGKLQTPIHTECDARGPLGQEASVQRYIQGALSTRLGIPRGGVSEGAGYVDRVVLTGVAIIGELPDLLKPTSTVRISYGAISYPRQEISL